VELCWLVTTIRKRHRTNVFCPSKQLKDRSSVLLLLNASSASITTTRTKACERACFDSKSGCRIIFSNWSSRALYETVKSSSSVFLTPGSMPGSQASCCGECSEANIMWSSSAKVNCVLFFCSVVLLCCVATKLVATALVCFHDVSLMYLCVESAHGVEGGALGQRTWHTWCPHLINRYTSRSVAIMVENR
jgi:hypothetical protein